MHVSTNLNLHETSPEIEKSGVINKREVIKLPYNKYAEKWKKLKVEVLEDDDKNSSLSCVKLPERWTVRELKDEKYKNATLKTIYDDKKFPVIMVWLENNEGTVHFMNPSESHSEYIEKKKRVLAEMDFMYGIADREKKLLSKL